VVQSGGDFADLTPSTPCPFGVPDTVFSSCLSEGPFTPDSRHILPSVWLKELTGK